MSIAIIGAGNVGGALAKSSVRAGHKVTLTAKNPAHADAKAKETGARAVHSAADAVNAADIVILAVPYAAVQKKAPKAKVREGAFNCAFASRQADPKVDGQSIDGYVASDDADAKKKTLDLARSIGFRPVDAGPLVMARALEALAILNIALQIQHGWPWETGWKLIGPTPGKAPA